jgi:phosphoserine phosphatase
MNTQTTTAADDILIFWVIFGALLLLYLVKELRRRLRIRRGARLLAKWLKGEGIAQ